MQKTFNIAWKMVLVIILGLTLVKAGSLYSKRDELITSKITMKYFVETVNLNDEERNKSFVADSYNNVLYTNFTSTMDNIYHFEGVTDFDI